MENALRTLEDVPLKGIRVRLEKVLELFLVEKLEISNCAIAHVGGPKCRPPPQ